jgi:hypothetical protein
MPSSASWSENDPATGWGNSADREAAEEAGWRFIREADFAAGAR